MGSDHTGGVSTTESNLVRSRGFRIASLPLGVVLMIAFAVTMFVFPVRTWLHQREVLADKKSEYAAYEDIVEQLQDQVLYLRTPEGLRDAIRTQLGYLQPNERRLPMMDIPALRHPPRTLAVHARVRCARRAHDRSRRTQGDRRDSTPAARALATFVQ